MLFKNILVPWDGSRHSNHAFKIALNIAKKYDSKINLVSCLSHADTGAGYLDSSINKDIFKTAKDAMMSKMFDLKNDVKKAGIFDVFDHPCLFLSCASVIKLAELVASECLNNFRLTLFGSSAILHLRFTIWYAAVYDNGSPNFVGLVFIHNGASGFSRIG